MEEYKKKSHRSNKFKIAGTTCDEDFRLSDGSYSVSCFET